jgi:hypothetical protein
LDFVVPDVVVVESEVSEATTVESEKSDQTHKVVINQGEGYYAVETR